MLRRTGARISAVAQRIADDFYFFFEANQLHTGNTCEFNAIRVRIINLLPYIQLSIGICDDLRLQCRYAHFKPILTISNWIQTPGSI